MSQNDFISRLGTWVLRKDPVGNERPYQLYKPEDQSKNYMVAQFYIDLQKSGVLFKPMIRVQATDSTCLLCEG